ncbi:threonine aspartase 1-like isoform X2 [Pecten maximus]|uniref:threonine aspartase 1-like isoform X1 n=1 Tax=Pecten maximus TaxID=6579 RepID=UPI001458EC30|nr:threonine aspartase 1-like isoform X1 [Pecten maximus]XP_033734533.1 threonine aspartase 1-like isoform X2 [Pecten maximus]
MTGTFIAVHAGAGYHSKDRESEYKKACAEACSLAHGLLATGASSLEAVTAAVISLENCPLTNAGTGSSLTLDGDVECDASIMEGRSLVYGGVGCVTGVKNPILVARSLLDEQKKGCLSLGRLPPSVLVGEGASIWAQDNGVELVDKKLLKTDSSLKTYESHKRKLDQHEERMKKKRTKWQTGNSPKARNEEDEPLPCIIQGVQDTVGAVAMDSDGNVSAAVSSGGISLKHSGRLGPAAMYGAGCWAHNWKSDKKAGVAITTSGSGEHLMRTLFAQKCAECVQTQDSGSLGVSLAFRDHFLESDYLSGITQKLGGVLALRLDKDDESAMMLEVIWVIQQKVCVLGTGAGIHTNQRYWYPVFQRTVNQENHLKWRGKFSLYPDLL